MPKYGIIGQKKNAPNSDVVFYSYNCRFVFRSYIYTVTFYMKKAEFTKMEVHLEYRGIHLIIR